MGGLCGGWVELLWRLDGWRVVAGWIDCGGWIGGVWKLLERIVEDGWVEWCLVVWITEDGSVDCES